MDRPMLPPSTRDWLKAPCAAATEHQLWAPVDKNFGMK